MLSLRHAVHCLALLAVTASFGAARAAGPTTADCLSANEDAIKLRKDRKLRAARDRWLVCAASSCPADVRAECARRVDLIDEQMPSIVFEAEDDEGHELGVVAVTMDGAPLAARLDGSALPLDPGQHVFTFRVEGRPPIDRTLIIHEGEKQRREIVTFGGGVGAAPMSPTENGQIRSGAAAVQRATPPGRLQRTVGIALGVAGLGALIVGGAFAGVAMSENHEADQRCPGAGPCTDGGRAVTLTADAKRDANIATVAFLAGGALVATGITLYFTAPRSGGARAYVAPVTAGRAITAGLTGVW